MLKKLLIATLFGTALLASAEQPSFELKISKPVLNRTIPSGSGMVPYKDGFLVVGDDSAYLYKINKHFKVQDKSLIKAYPARWKERIDRKIKLDFEAMAQFRHEHILWNMIVGSGSTPDTREFGYLIAADGSHRHERKLGALYRQFSELGELTGTQHINIEGLAIAGEEVFFLNRGNSAGNIIFRVALGEIYDYMTGKIERLEKIKKYDVRLPVVDGVEAGLSGADFWPEIDALIYTASIEASNNAYGDEKILSSFIGLIRLDSLHDDQLLDLSNSAQQVMRKGKVLITKVESVALTASDKNGASGALVSDNDNGRSEFFRFSLKLKP